VDLDPCTQVFLPELTEDGAEQIQAVPSQSRRIRNEVKATRLEDYDATLSVDSNESVVWRSTPLLGAAVIVLIAVHILCFEGTLVDVVDNEVAVVVFICTAVLILEGIKILGDARTAVLSIWDTVFVVIILRTAVLVAITVDVFRYRGTAIGPIEPIAIHIRWRATTGRNGTTAGDQRRAPARNQTQKLLHLLHPTS
jgi:hypothetical protein